MLFNIHILNVNTTSVGYFKRSYLQLLVYEKNDNPFVGSDVAPSTTRTKLNNLNKHTLIWHHCAARVCNTCSHLRDQIHVDNSVVTKLASTRMKGVVFTLQYTACETKVNSEVAMNN